MESLGVVILTYNEEKHIARCIDSVKKIASKIIVIDSFSTDNTVDIAKSYGAEVYTNKWVNYATQFNFGLDIIEGSDVEYVLRLDADEYLTNEMSHEIASVFSKTATLADGYYLKRKVHFLGRWIKYGDCYPIWLLRIWRNGIGRCENRWMDEHIKLASDNTDRLKSDFVDDNLNNLTWWFEKHNNYATREAVDILNYQYGFIKYDDVAPVFNGSQEQRKRWLKVKYSTLPLFIRPLLYFIYRFFFKLGFLDGRRGLIWHFLQGFCYRFLVDAKIYDIKRRLRNDKSSIEEVLKKYYSISVK